MNATAVADAVLAPTDARAAMAYRNMMAVSAETDFPLPDLPSPPTHPAVRAAALREAIHAMRGHRENYYRARNLFEVGHQDEEATMYYSWMHYTRAAAYAYLLSPTSTRQSLWEKGKK